MRHSRRPMPSVTTLRDKSSICTGRTELESAPITNARSCSCTYRPDRSMACTFITAHNGSGKPWSTRPSAYMRLCGSSRSRYKLASECSPSASTTGACAARARASPSAKHCSTPSGLLPRSSVCRSRLVARARPKSAKWARDGAMRL